jgi:hypothetical protein
MYMAQFDGVTILGTKHLVFQLHRALYGLKQSPHAWYFKMNSTLFQANLIKSRVEPNS